MEHIAHKQSDTRYIQTSNYKEQNVLYINGFHIIINIISLVELLCFNYKNKMNIFLYEHVQVK